MQLSHGCCVLFISDFESTADVGVEQNSHDAAEKDACHSPQVVWWDPV